MSPNKLADALEGQAGEIDRLLRMAPESEQVFLHATIIQLHLVITRLRRAGAANA